MWGTGAPPIAGWPMVSGPVSNFSSATPPSTLPKWRGHHWPITVGQSGRSIYVPRHPVGWLDGVAVTVGTGSTWWWTTVPRPAVAVLGGVPQSPARASPPHCLHAPSTLSLTTPLLVLPQVRNLTLFGKIVSKRHHFHAANGG